MSQRIGRAWFLRALRGSKGRKKRQKYTEKTTLSHRDGLLTAINDGNTLLYGKDAENGGRAPHSVVKFSSVTSVLRRNHPVTNVIDGRTFLLRHPGSPRYSRRDAICLRDGGGVWDEWDVFRSVCFSLVRTGPALVLRHGGRSGGRLSVLSRLPHARAQAPDPRHAVIENPQRLPGPGRSERAGSRPLHCSRTHHRRGLLLPSHRCLAAEAGRQEQGMAEGCRGVHASALLSR